MVKHWKKIKLSPLLLLLLLATPHAVYAYDKKPDITAQGNQRSQPRDWQRNSCCNFLAPLKSTSETILEQLEESEDILKISEIVRSVWKKHTIRE